MDNQLSVIVKRAFFIERVNPSFGAITDTPALNRGAVANIPGDCCLFTPLSIVPL